MRKPLILLLLSLNAICAQAEITAPEITRARFDATGKLHVSVEDVGYAGCYLTVNGGLTDSEISTAIVSTQVSSKQETAQKLTIKTKRRYYCRKRTLYVAVEKVCLGAEIGSATSSVKAVSVPKANLKR